MVEREEREKTLLLQAKDIVENKENLTAMLGSNLEESQLQSWPSLPAKPLHRNSVTGQEDPGNQRETLCVMVLTSYSSTERGVTSHSRNLKPLVWLSFNWIHADNEDQILVQDPATKKGKHILYFLQSPQLCDTETTACN
jgi:hypothetical protein